MKYFINSLGIFAALLLWGCISSEPEFPADLTLNELELKMEKAMDPEGSFAKANSFVQQQMLEVKGFFYDDMFQLNVRYKKPGFLKVTTLEYNQPISSIIFNQGSGWLVDYRQKKVRELGGKELLRLNVLNNMANPSAKYQQLFKNVGLTQVIMNERPYYKIHCQSETPGDADLNIYVDKNNFLTKKITASFKIGQKPNEKIYDYTTNIEVYEQFDNVMIPQKSRTFYNDSESISTVFLYKLNAKIDDSEFLPPIFTGK